MQQFLGFKASAGSGKTFNLSIRFIYLLFSGANPAQILSLTFSKAASAEMGQRIKAHLKSLSKSFTNGDYKNNDVYKALRENGLSHDDLINNIDDIYEAFLQGNTRITTIDAFFNSVLKKFCWYVNLSSRFEIGNINQAMINELFLARLFTNDKDAFSSLIGFCFYHKIQTNAFLNLLNDELSSLDSTLLTKDSQKFTYQSSDEIASIITQKIKQIYVEIKAQNKDKRAEQLFAKTNIEDIVNIKALCKWDEHSWLKKYDLSTINNTRNEILSLIRIYFDEKEMRIFECIRQYIKRFKVAKNAHLKQENYLDFNDVMMKNYELLHLHFDSHFFYFRLDERISHILLDEFQDTSRMQYEILEPILDEISSGIGQNIKDRSIFVVGDEKQSIYGWRGSFSAVFDDVTKHLGEVKDLEYNWRSMQNIITFNNHIFEKHFKHYIPQKPAKTKDYKGFVRVITENDDIEATKKAVFDEVKALLDAGIDENDITILVFKNDDAIELKDEILMQQEALNLRRKIQIVTQTDTSLFTKTSVRVILNGLYILQNEAKIAKAKDYVQIDMFKKYTKLCKKHITKLLGLPYNDESVNNKLDTLHLSYKDTPANVVLALIRAFNIAESASMAFLEFSCAYDSIDECLESIPKTIRNAPKQSNRGIKIMTIYKSKGLEFEYVIVCDRLSKERQDNFVILPHYNGVKVQTLYYKMKGREAYDSDYAKALEAYNEREKQERYNVLYVAFTRAKCGLSVIVRNKEKQKPSAFEILNLSARDEAICPNPQMTNQTLLSTSQNKIQPILHRLKHYGRQEDFISKTQQNAQINTTTRHNMIFGSAMHSAFEGHLSYGYDDNILQNLLFNHYGYALDTKQITEAICAMRSCVDSQTFKNLCENKRIMCEVSYISNGELYRMDTILCGDDEYVVLDYKSSLGNTTEDIQAQETQLKGYMRFLQTILAKEHKINNIVKGFIIYPLRKHRQFREIIV